MNTKELGYVVSITTFFVLTIMVTVGLAMASLAVLRQKIATNAISSTQSYYAAESGIEDALQRLDNNPQMAATSYTLTVGPASVDVVIPDSNNGGWRVVTSQGSKINMKRNIQVIYGTATQNANFYYGIMAGAGGVSMGGGSTVNGNVFSAGNVSGAGTITQDAVISGTTSLQGVQVSGSAYVRSCLSPAIVGNLTYVTGGTKTCTVQGTTTLQSAAIANQPMPIPQSQITSWQAEAAAGTTYNGLNVPNGNTVYLGPAKVQGNITMGTNAKIIITGTVYVTGTVTMQSGARISLDSSYRTMGGVLISDGVIAIGNGCSFAGSGQATSYLMLITTSSNANAITVNNNALGVVLYAPNGGVSIANGASVLEATGYSVTLGNNAQVQYSTGIANIYFSSGPSSKGKVINWIEN